MLQAGFEPSPHLNDALHRFLLPRYANRDIILRSTTELRLGYSDSTNDGISYHAADNERLARDKRHMRLLGSQAIAIKSVALGVSERGDVRLDMKLAPSRYQRQLLGGFVLGELLEEPDTSLWVYTRFFASTVRPLYEVKAEARALHGAIKSNYDAQTNTVRPSDLYVAKPRILERSGDIRAVP